MNDPVNETRTEKRSWKGSRSIESRKRKNKKTKVRQKKAKQFASILKIAEKDNVIENLEARLQTYQDRAHRPTAKITVSKSCNLLQTSSVNIQKRRILATQETKHFGLSKARQTILSSLSGIPSFHSNHIQWMSIPGDNFGSGQFGELKLIKLKSLDIVVAVKLCNSNNSQKAIDVETIIGMTVGGHPNFPYVYGLLDKKNIVMQFFGEHCSDTWFVSPNLSKAIASFSSIQFRNICQGILEAFIWLHEKGILHNDIKADNIVVHKQVPKIIDFGKANMVSSVLTYNIQPGSAEHERYEKYHRHLAYELRNIPGSVQSFKTDIYSIGYMFKHLSLMTTPPSNRIFKLAKMMKNQDSNARISLKNAKNKLFVC